MQPGNLIHHHHHHHHHHLLQGLHMYEPCHKKSRFLHMQKQSAVFLVHR